MILRDQGAPERRIPLATAMAKASMERLTPMRNTENITGLLCNEENLKQLHRDSNVVFNDKIDSSIAYKKWLFGHWHSDWGYEHYNESKYVPLYHQGIVI